MLLRRLHPATVDAASGKIQIGLIVETVVATIGAAIPPASVPVPVVPKLTIADWHVAHVVDNRDVVWAAALLLHGPLLDVVGELSGGHPVGLLAVGLKLGGAKLGLCESSGCVGDWLLRARSEGCKAVHVVAVAAAVVGLRVVAQVHAVHAGVQVVQG